MNYLASSSLIDLVCSVCGRSYNADTLQSYCKECNAPLLARYDIAKVRKLVEPQVIRTRQRGIWRWSELLPVRDIKNRITLGEGDTPLIETVHLHKELGLKYLFIKDESRNPTGTFKARGLVMAVARGRELGVRSFVIPTAGNAGGALAAYAARANCEAHIYMPEDAPIVNKREVTVAGANLYLVNGLITDAARFAKAEADKHSYFDVSTFKEPYRLEGKKTMGFEIAEAFNWNLPEVIIYPTGGGTGLVGIWKAFQELEELGWISSARPRMVSVQSTECAPIVRAFNNGDSQVSFWENSQTIASGLRVPAVFADRLILKILKDSHGTAIAVSDEEIIAAQKEIATLEGIFTAPEGAATYAALHHLVRDGWIKANERIVLLNTGSGLKYLS